MSNVAGVYVIFGPANRVYVGESANILRRDSVQFARRMGLSWTILRYMSGSTSAQRRVIEAKAHQAYRANAFNVVSLDKHESARAGACAAVGKKRPPLSAEHRAKVSASLRRTFEARGQAWRSEQARLGWESRRRNRSDGRELLTQPFEPPKDITPPPAA